MSRSRPCAAVTVGAAAAAVAALAAGCSASVGAPQTSVSGSSSLGSAAAGLPSASPAPASPSAPAAGRSDKVSAVFTAGGVSQWIDCRGAGPATYVIIPGLHSDASDWTEVLPAMRKQTRTCVYDRPGLGNSPARTSGPTTVNAAPHARELSALLKAAGEPGPFIPLGHSYGGLVARAFAMQQAPSVVGVFLADGVAPYYYSEGTSWSEANTSVDLVASSNATKAADFGEKPLLVMSASVANRDYLNGPGNGTDAAAWTRDQRAAVKLSSNSIQVIATSAHVLQQDNDAAVILATQTLLDAVVANSQLTCAADWSSVDAKCIPGGRK